MSLTCTANGADGTADTVVITVSADNDAPTANAGTDQTGSDEGDVITLAGSGTDPESESLSYAWTQTDSTGISITLSDSTAAGPTFTAPQSTATYTLTFSLVVTDATGAASSADTVDVTITADNDAPTADAGSAQTVAEGATVTLDGSGSSDPEGESLTYTWSQTAGTSITISDTSAVSPTFVAVEASTDYTVTLQLSVTDNTNTAVTDSVVITVTADNDAPSFDSSAVTSATEDSEYSYTVTTSDPEGDTVTVTCTTCPSWLSYSGGVLSGTPGDSDVGANSVELTATDQVNSVTQSFTVTVANINDVGTITLSGTPTEDQVLTATVADDDGLSGVTVTYEWQRSSDASTWSTISGATSSTYTLTQSDVANYMRVIAVWTDAQGGSESHSAMISTTVANVNDDNTGTPTMSGTTTEDQTLTADASPLDGNDEDGMTGSSYSYQWQGCTTSDSSSCSDLSGATSSTYTLGDTVAGGYVRVAVSYTDDYSTTETVYSAMSAQITNVNDDPTGSVTISGTAEEDQVLTASNDIADNDGMGTITYTWSNGQTGTSITLGQSDVNTAITVTASYTDAQGTTESVTSSATSAVANVNDAGTGLSLGSTDDASDPDEGDTLSVSGTLADDDGVTGAAPTYSWSTGDTTSSITLGQGDVGDTISVTISYTDDLGGSNTITLTADSDVDNVNDDPTGSVTISGTPTEDEVLTASNDIADEDGLGTITYTWSNGDTGATTTLGQSDVGTTITVTASYTDAYGASESVTSSATTAVANVNDAGSGLSLGSDGDVADPDQGDTLSVTGTLADEDGVTGASPTYLWSTGDTTSSITLSQGDVGDTISVTISYTDDQSESNTICLLYTSPSPRDVEESRMPSSA